MRPETYDQVIKLAEFSSRTVSGQSRGVSDDI